MIEVIKDFLTNPIVVNWIAPIITGLIVLAIPTIFINFLRIRKDSKKVYEVNRRYLDAIRPYIIQKISINDKFITDIRNGIIKESNIKDKYVYTPIELKNKLILDITESNYINETNKKELLDFTYNAFKNFDVEHKNDLKQEVQKSAHLTINKLLIIFILSFISCIIIWIFNGEKTDLTNSISYELSFVVSFISFIILIMEYFTNNFKSHVSNKNLTDKIKYFFFESVNDAYYVNEIYDRYKNISTSIKRKKIDKKKNEINNKKNS